MTVEDAAQASKSLLDEMPKNSILRIPKIEINIGNFTSDPWDLIKNLYKYSSFNGHNIIIIDQVYTNYEVPNGPGQNLKYRHLKYTNIVIDSNKTISETPNKPNALISSVGSRKFMICG